MLHSTDVLGQKQVQVHDKALQLLQQISGVCLRSIPFEEFQKFLRISISGILAQDLQL